MIDVDITQLCNVYVLRAYQTNNSVCSFFFQQVEMLSFVRESGPQRQTMTKLSVRKRTKKIKKNNKNQALTLTCCSWYLKRGDAIWLKTLPKINFF